MTFSIPKYPHPDKHTIQKIREQSFQNYLALQDYRNAMLLALAMEQPGRLHTLFKNLPASASSAEDVASITGSSAVDAVLRTLGGIDLAKLLRYVRDWNAQARTSIVAQRVLHAVVKLRRADDIARAFDAASVPTPSSFAIAFPSTTDDATDAGGRGAAGAATSSDGRGASALREVVEALVPYTERHLARMEKLVQESYVVDYLLGEMDDGMFGLDGHDDDDAADDAVELMGVDDIDDSEEEEWGGMDIDVSAGVPVGVVA